MTQQDLFIIEVLLFSESLRGCDSRISRYILADSRVSDHVEVDETWMYTQLMHYTTPYWSYDHVLARLSIITDVTVSEVSQIVGIYVQKEMPHITGGGRKMRKEVSVLEDADFTDASWTDDKSPHRSTLSYVLHCNRTLTTFSWKSALVPVHVLSTSEFALISVVFCTQESGGEC